MAQFSDFSSFFEVGIGIGIALSLFRIPIDNRKFALIRKIENELTLFAHQSTPEATSRYEKAGEISILLDGAIQELERRVRHFPVVALLGALSNVVLLFVMALDSSREVHAGEISLFGFVAFGWYALMSAAIFWIVEETLGPVDRELSLKA